MHPCGILRLLILNLRPTAIDALVEPWEPHKLVERRTEALVIVTGRRVWLPFILPPLAVGGLDTETESSHKPPRAWLTV